MLLALDKRSLTFQILLYQEPILDHCLSLVFSDAVDKASFLSECDLRFSSLHSNLTTHIFWLSFCHLLYFSILVSTKMTACLSQSYSFPFAGKATSLVAQTVKNLPAMQETQV